MLELLCGEGVLAEVFRKRGFDITTLDNNPDLNPDIVADILDIDPGSLPGPFLYIHASPVCTTFSVCQLSRHYKNRIPWSSKAHIGIAILIKCIEIIEYWKPEYWTIENPRGMMRHVPRLQQFHRVTVTYCQYGEDFQKPTDFWMPCPFWIPKKACSAGDSCHQAQPRGYRAKKDFNAIGKGTQGLSNAQERGKFPVQLCEEIADAIEGKQKTSQSQITNYSRTP